MYCIPVYKHFDCSRKLTRPHLLRPEMSTIIGAMAVRNSAPVFGITSLIIQCVIEWC